MCEVRRHHHPPPDRFSVCEFSTMTASFEGVLGACKLGGAHGVGICEAKLPAGGDAAALEKFRASGLRRLRCACPRSFLSCRCRGSPARRNRNSVFQALIAGIRRLAVFRPACCFCLTGPKGKLEEGRARAIVVRGLRQATARRPKSAFPWGSSRSMPHSRTNGRWFRPSRDGGADRGSGRA